MEYSHREFGRSARFATHLPDYPQLIASLAAAQASSPTAAAAMRAALPMPPALKPLDAFAALYSDRPGWRAAAAALGHAFHPFLAGRLHRKRLVNDPDHALYLGISTFLQSHGRRDTHTGDESADRVEVVTE